MDQIDFDAVVAAEDARTEAAQWDVLTEQEVAVHTETRSIGTLRLPDPAAAQALIKALQQAVRESARGHQVGIAHGTPGAYVY